MSKKQKIRWSKSIGNEEQTLYGLWGSVSAWSGMLLDAVCGFLFVMAARMMITDVFAIDGADGWNIVSMLFTAVVISVVMEMAKCFVGGARYGIYAGVFVVGIFLCWFIANYVVEWDVLRLGYYDISKTVMEYWNQYYGTDFVIDNPVFANASSVSMYDVEECVVEALNFTSFVLLYFCLWEAKLRRRNISLLVVPLLVFVLELLVGYSPKLTSMCIVFTTVLLSNAHRWGDTAFKRMRITKSNIGAEYNTTVSGTAGITNAVSRFNWIVVGIGAWLTCMLTSAFGMSSAGHVIDNADAFKSSVNAWIEDVMNGDMFGGGSKVNDVHTLAKLDNNPPKYENVPVLSVNVSDKLAGNIYFKGFQANTYRNGVWTEELDKFYKKVEEQNFIQSDILYSIPMLGVSKLNKQYEVEDFADCPVATSMTISYHNKSDGRAFIPYFGQIYNETIMIRGEGLYVKEKDVDSLDLYVWRNGGVYEKYINSLELYTDSVFEIWYSDYVNEYYTVVPENLYYVTSIMVSVILGDNYGEIVFDEFTDVNARRVILANTVSQWMQDNTTYSLTPPPLPEDMDPIEFFLLDSNEGYCMHYASAGVMLLRHMGVPARYVTGYVAGSHTFVQDDTSYNVTIRDNQAHAWVEIFLEGIGWVPVEVTKGYNENVMAEDDERPTEPEQPSTEEPSTEEPTSHEPATEDEPTTESDTTKQGETTTGNNTGNGEGSDGGATLLDTLKILIPIVLIVSVVGFVAYNIYRNHALYTAKLESDITNRRTRLVIRKVNRRLYKRLRRSGRVFKPYITDDEYCRILKKTYPHIEDIDWNRYINIVKAAAFSTAEFTVEEMEFCLKMWRMVTEKNKSEAKE